MGRLFGTDGVRGVANTELTCEMAYNLGRAGAYVLAQTGKHQPRILIGRDTRVSGGMLSAALTAGICSVGAYAADAGVITTPGVAHLTRAQGYDAGVMISASHNPVKDNGIKFFSRDGYKLSDSLEERIEAILLDGAEELPCPTGAEVGGVAQAQGARESYLAHCISMLGMDAGGMKVVLDCANGAASEYAPEIFAQIGCRVVATHCEPDGLNINLNCGSTHPESLQKAVVQQGAAAGFAFDGDADRLIVVDEKGELVDGDQIMAIVGMHLHGKGRLPKDTVVATVMSNMGLEIALREKGISLLRAAVGDRYVLEAMLEGGYVYGGEQSGHFIHLDDGTTGDGIVSAIRLLSILLETGKPLSELAAVVERLPQVLINVPVANERKNNLLEDASIHAHVQALEKEMGGTGRLLVRPSGTEALVRVMIEGPDGEIIHRQARELAEAIERSERARKG